MRFQPNVVMAGLDPAIHAAPPGTSMSPKARTARMSGCETWMAGTRPAMTAQAALAGL